MDAFTDPLPDDLDLKLRSEFGDTFVPERAADLREPLVRTLIAFLPEHDEKQVASAFDEAVIRTRITLDWRQFLCVLLRQLPGWWTKLTTGPGFGASRKNARMQMMMPCPRPK